MKVKVNDTVLVLTGKDKGKMGKVIATAPKKGKIAVEGINIQKRHKKARSANEPSTILSKEGMIDASNVLVFCEACQKASRVKYEFVQENGETKKSRVCRKCGAVLDKKYTKSSKASAAAVEQAPKKRERKRSTKAAEEN